MLEAVGEARGREAKLSRRASTLIVGAVVFAVSVFLEALPRMGAWMDLVTIYIAPFGAVLGAVFIYFVLGMKAAKAELNLGRRRPLGRAFTPIAYCYVVLAAAVVVLGIWYGGIG